jgi:uncharacterized protein YecE (DUF72 family)
VGVIRVGTCSWTDRELLGSGWYPRGVRTPEQRLAHYASRFPLVEVDSTYYAPPTERNCSRWAQWTPDGFTFHVKAFSLMTGHPTRVAAMDPDLRPATTRATVRAGDLDPGVVEEVWERFCAALVPLHGSGKLAAVLLQLPPWFAASTRNAEHVLECCERLRPYRACVEVRNATWVAEGTRERTLGLLRGSGIPYVCVDMPQGSASSVPPLTAATADLAVVRLHGRGLHWDSGDRYLRYAYRYSAGELREWVPRIEHLAQQADVHVLVNTCGGDAPQATAAQLVELLGEAGAPVVAPPAPVAAAHNGGDALFPAPG